MALPCSGNVCQHEGLRLFTILFITRVHTGGHAASALLGAWIGPWCTRLRGACEKPTAEHGVDRQLRESGSWQRSDSRTRRPDGPRSQRSLKNDDPARNRVTSARVGRGEKILEVAEQIRKSQDRATIRDRGCRAAGARLRGTGAGRANRRTGRPRRGTRHGHRAVAHTGISNTTPAHASPTRKLHADSAYWGSRTPRLPQACVARA